MSPAGFLLFGMGSRRKFVYAAGGHLLDAITLEPVRSWDVAREELEASEYRVSLETRRGEAVRIVEDEEGVWVEERGGRELLSRGSPVRLPRFDGHPQARWLRALHAEILVNVTPGGPVPNLWVYPRPWYRDAAMMLMCLRETGNLGLVEKWCLGLHKPFDRNNSGNAEPDNLGQVLYMLSLFDAQKHPLVEGVLKAASACRRGDHIIGRTDYAEHPVYQTKWLKFGLRALGLDDPYRVPAVFDSYSALFWMDYRDAHVAGERFSARALELYPYLNWAEAHFFDEAPPEPLGDLRPPLTREGAGSEAEYWRLRPLADLGIISAEQATSKVCRPHTWHAAEMFLYLTRLGA